MLYELETSFSVSRATVLAINAKDQKEKKFGCIQNKVKEESMAMECQLFSSNASKNLSVFSCKKGR